MNAELLLILDRALQFSAWCFLASALFLLLIAHTRTRRRRRQVGEFLERDPEQSAGNNLLAFDHPAFNQWRIAFQITVVSLALAAFSFFVYLFMPLSWFENFSASASWRVEPLRLTALSYDRFYEGFSAEGEVWNQTTEPLGEVTARITVWGIDDKPIGEISASVSPNPLPPGQAGSFSIRYEENSPFIKGYKIAFVDAEEHPIVHISGFDAP